jgi:hypothetical protein
MLQYWQALICVFIGQKKQRRVKTSAATLNKSKKEKGFFFSFRFKTTSLRHRHIGRMSEALCDLGEPEKARIRARIMPN